MRGAAEQITKARSQRARRGAAEQITKAVSQRARSASKKCIPIDLHRVSPHPSAYFSHTVFPLGIPVSES